MKRPADRGDLLPRSARSAARVRLVCTFFLLFHWTAMGASLAKDTAPGRWVRGATAPYERAFGLWQSWGMFGPNPPLGTSWLFASGLTAQGQVQPVAALVGERVPDRIDLRYDRTLKVERNMFDTSNRSLRAAFAAWRCRQAADQGRPLVSVRVWKEREMSPTPAHRGTSDPPPPVRKVSELGVYTCP